MNTASSSRANPYAPPQAEVRDTVTQNETELAGRGTRFGAAMLDGLILVLLVGAPLFVGADIDAMSTDFTGGLSTTGMTLAGIGALILAGVTTYLVHRNGQTIGKKLLGIKVVRSDASPASLARIFWLRNVVNGIPGVIPVIGNAWGTVDHVFIFVGDKRQCVHDKIADTIVIKA